MKVNVYTTSDGAFLLSIPGKGVDKSMEDLPFTYTSLGSIDLAIEEPKEELKKCPACGGDRIIQRVDGLDRLVIECKNNDCRIYLLSPCNNHNAAIKLWNGGR